MNILEILTYDELSEMWQNVYDLFYANDLEITEEMQKAMQENLKNASK